MCMCIGLLRGPLGLSANESGCKYTRVPARRGSHQDCLALVDRMPTPSDRLWRPTTCEAHCFDAAELCFPQFEYPLVLVGRSHAVH
eukprot:2005264-Heterocapsa_arctica.AAC.1